MVRIANINDANQLEILNNKFYSTGETTLESIKNSILTNEKEIIIVDEEKDILTGFICVQIKKSFCYDALMLEITGVYVNPQYRKRGIAKAMLSFVEEYCKKHYLFHKLELLTGEKNIIAQTVYQKMGYKKDGEIHLTKSFNQ